MGDWRFDQSKGGRRHVWQQTRGEQDPTRRNFVERIKTYPVFKGMRIEKIGGELHVWRENVPKEGSSYWTSCMRFKDDSWGYWTVYYRTDERRWRSTGIEDQPVGKAIDSASEFWREKFVI